MGKRTLIEQFINRHSKELEESIKLINPKLIEAFVKVYGEAHRNHITYIINNIEYIFFISEDYNRLYSKMHRNISKKNIHIMQCYIRYLTKNNHIFNSVDIEDQEKFIVERYLPRYPFEIEDYSVFSDAIETDCPCCSATYYGSRISRVK